LSKEGLALFSDYTSELVALIGSAVTMSVIERECPGSLMVLFAFISAEKLLRLS
jgi:hypothetical protein